MPKRPTKAEERAARRAVREWNEKYAAIEARHAETVAQQLAATQAELMKMILSELGVNTHIGAGEAVFQTPEAPTLPETERRIATLERLIATLAQRGDVERARHFQDELDQLHGVIAPAEEAVAALAPEAMAVTTTALAPVDTAANTISPTTPQTGSAHATNGTSEDKGRESPESDIEGWELVRAIDSEDEYDCAGVDWGSGGGGGAMG